MRFANSPRTFDAHGVAMISPCGTDWGVLGHISMHLHVVGGHVGRVGWRLLQATICHSLWRCCCCMGVLNHVNWCLAAPRHPSALFKLIASILLCMLQVVRQIFCACGPALYSIPSLNCEFVLGNVVASYQFFVAIEALPSFVRDPRLGLRKRLYSEHFGYVSLSLSQTGHYKYLSIFNVIQILMGIKRGDLEPIPGHPQSRSPRGPGGLNMKDLHDF